MKKSVLILLALFSGGLAFAQGGKFGATPEDSVSCVQAISLYREFAKQKNYPDARSPWKIAWTTCPAARKFIHTDGEKMYKAFIKENKDNEELVQPLIDTLMMVYDARIEAFGERGYVLEKKGTAVNKYRKDNYEEAYGYLKEAHELRGNKYSATAVSQYYKAAYYYHLKAKKIDKAEFLELYSTLSDVCEHNMKECKNTMNDAEATDKAKGKAERNLKNYTSAQENIDKIFAKVGECEDLVPLFTPKFEATPDDAKLRATILKLFIKGDCLDNDLYPAVAERDLLDNPTAEGYLNLAKYHAKKNNCTKALELLKKGEEVAEEPDMKVDIYFTMAQCHYNNRSLESVRSYARKVLAINPNHGRSYMIIGDAYASAKLSGQACEQKAKFWAAYDKYAKAKAVDPEVAAAAGKKMGGARGNFPGKTDCFFLNMKDGDPYTVGGWIQETTTVRTQGE